MNGQQRRKLIKNFITTYRTEHGFAPSLDDIAHGVGLSGKGAVHHHIAILLADGEITMDEGKARTVAVVGNTGETK